MSHVQAVMNLLEDLGVDRPVWVKVEHPFLPGGVIYLDLLATKMDDSESMVEEQPIILLTRQLEKAPDEEARPA